MRGGAVLVTVNTGWTPEFLLLPGGGQDHGEPMHETLVRECREEIGAEVVVGDLAFVRDYVGAHHEFAEQDQHYHAIEIVFWASLAPGSEPDLGIRSDTFQTGARWLPLEELEAEGWRWAQEILSKSPLAIRLLKSAFNADLDGQAGLQELAGNATLLFYMTEQGQEGRNAYVEKRKPDFRKYPWLPW